MTWVTYSNFANGCRRPTSLRGDHYDGVILVHPAGDEATYKCHIYNPNCEAHRKFRFVGVLCAEAILKQNDLAGLT